MKELKNELTILPAFVMFASAVCISESPSTLYKRKSHSSFRRRAHLSAVVEGEWHLCCSQNNRYLYLI